MAKEIQIDESKKIQTGLLQCVHNFCEENGLTYYLIFGTLLGAVRHKGFIPWDDDIDIAMPRKDYEVFMKTFGEQNNCKAVSCAIDSEYYLPFGKVYDIRTILKEDICLNKEIGVYIDIFPIDPLSKSRIKYKINTYKLLLLRNILSIKMLPGSNKRKGIRKIIHAVLNKLFVSIDMNKASRKMDRLAQKENANGDFDFFGIRANVDRNGIKRQYAAGLFSNKILLEFEGQSFYAPKEYHKMLTQIYGDYMKLPPEEQRVSRHDYKQYRK